MSFEIFLTETAEQQLNAAADWYAATDIETATAWFNGLLDALESLRSNPERFPLARECRHLPVQLRQMLYGVGKRKTHRILFVIRATRIVVHQIRHVSQRDIEEL